MTLKNKFLKKSIRLQGLAEVVCIGLGLATLFGFIGKLHWILDLFSHFRVQYFQICLLLIVFFFWKRHYRWLATTLCLAVVNYAVVLPFYFGKPDAALKTEKSIRVMQMNLHAENRAVETVLSAVKKYNADFMLLEEVTSQWESDLHVLSAAYPHRISHPRSDSFGILLLSRFPFRSSEVVFIGNDDLPTICANIETPQGTISLIGTHPLPPLGKRCSTGRNQQLAALPEWVKQQSHPVLLVGDLNLSPWSPWFSALLKDSGLKNSMQGFGFQPSWPQNNPFFRIPIDHILHSSDLTIVQRAIGADVGSDHLPVIVDFKRISVGGRP